MSRVGWTSSPARSARRWAARRVAILRAKAKWSTGCVSAYGAYLFSNTLMPAIAGASIKVFELIRHGDALRERLFTNAARFRSEIGKLGFMLAGADQPLIPVMLGEATLAQEMAARMLKRDIYVIGFLPGGAERPGAHPHADVGGAFHCGH
ncbi:aminotransferase class I/II-fold pyridoxal phosphate-dependent enzyme [Mesorhizobium sp. M0522]